MIPPTADGVRDGGKKGRGGGKMDRRRRNAAWN